MSCRFSVMTSLSNMKIGVCYVDFTRVQGLRGMLRAMVPYKLPLLKIVFRVVQDGNSIATPKSERVDLLEY